MADVDSTDGLDAAKLAVTFDHHSPEYARDSWAINRALRKGCPVAHSERHGGFWIATTHEDVTRIANDDATFSSDHDPTGERRGPGFTGILLPEKGPFRQIPIEMDPPESLAYRRLVMKAFTPGAAARLRPFVEHWVAVCLDRVIETGEMDVIRDLASPVPALIAASFVGLPLEDWRRYAGPVHKMIYSLVGSPDWKEAYDGLFWQDAQLKKLLAARREDPRDDVLTLLGRAELDGKPLSDDEVVGMTMLIIHGGFDTTGALIAGALLWLSEHPEERQRLIDDRALLKPACEEFLRYVTPTQVLSRTITRDVDVHGQGLGQGEKILISWASANQDETVFECPEQVRFDRPGNNHYAFGVGSHICLGASIVRMQWPIVMNAILDRMPDFKIDRGRSLPYQSKGTVNGWVHMRATFTPGSRIKNDPQAEFIIAHEPEPPAH